MRAIAWFTVFCSHLLPRDAVSIPVPGWAKAVWVAAVPAGTYGVTLFFVLSSFLITSLLLDEQARTGVIDIRAFYVRRVLRIWPLYFAILALGTLISPLVTPSVPVTGQVLFRYVTFTGNLAAVAGAAAPISIGILWSVCVEEQFYLCWPWVLRIFRGRAMVAACLAMIGMGALVRYQMTAHSSHFVWGHSLTHLDCFALGALVALWVRRSPASPTRATPMLILLGLLGLPLAEHVLHLRMPGQHTTTPWEATAYFVMAALCALVVWQAALLKGGLLCNGLLTGLGKRTYGLYCFHGLVLSIAWHFLDRWHFWPVAAPALAGTLGLAFLSYRFYEMPFLRLKRRFQKVESGGA
ncbi:MAG: acyltransferase [Fimbriimonas ginsengisoli]|uniref:Acyltransferase n=1 Tax=Fimbriimonas ginsengisoli TaxID=1005039 RepID=A0A931LVN4_FIMGI|nr:acyltransferase [Fimbriimonas ginsengisoli]